MKSIELLPVGTKVRSTIETQMTGSIAGYTILRDFNEFNPSLKYIVRLNAGFFNPERTTFTDMLVFDPSALTEEE